MFRVIGMRRAPHLRLTVSRSACTTIETNKSGSHASLYSQNVSKFSSCLPPHHSAAAMAVPNNGAVIIPTVDLTAFLEDPNSPAAEAVVEQIRAACTTSGFFQLTGHGVSQELQERVFKAARALFALPDEEKRKLSGKPGRGYEVLGAQTLERGKKPDLKEVRDCSA
jgi:hypothetical protein